MSACEEKTDLEAKNTGMEDSYNCPDALLSCLRASTEQSMFLCELVTILVLYSIEFATSKTSDQGKKASVH